MLSLKLSIFRTDILSSQHTAYEVDRAIKTAMRKRLQPRLKDVRQQIERRSKQVSPPEAEQLAVLSDYALGIQTALHFDGTLPFDYPAVAAAEALDEGLM